jgi:hypothetical protein
MVPGPVMLHSSAPGLVSTSGLATAGVLAGVGTVLVARACLPFAAIREVAAFPEMVVSGISARRSAALLDRHYIKRKNAPTLGCYAPR